MEQTDEWLGFLRTMGRKESSLRTLRACIRRCLGLLAEDGRPTDAYKISESDIIYLWTTLPLKENVRWSYLRNLSNMIEHFTGTDIVKNTRILHNRVEVTRVFISKDDFRKAYAIGDARERLILCLGAYMGLRRGEMAALRDEDIADGLMIVHGKVTVTRGTLS